MTAETPIDAAELAELIARLEREVHNGMYRPGGGSICTGPEGGTYAVTTYGGGKIMVPANPDGSAAITALRQQAARIAELEAGRAGAAEAERAAIVAWLGKRALIHKSKWMESRDPHMDKARDAIERGEHHAA